MEWRPINTFVSRHVKDMEVMGESWRARAREKEGEKATGQTPFLHRDS